MIKYFSAFSGIGGFELGIQQAYEDLSNAKRQKQGWDTRHFANVDGEQVGAQPFHSGDFLQKKTCSILSENCTDIESREGWPNCVGYSEIDKYAIQVYQKHFKHKNYGDITKIKPEEIPDFDLFVGGFPCQAFSVAGLRAGFNDKRGLLIFDVARILSAKRPRLFFLENVKGLLSHDRGRTFATILATFNELGYDCQWQVLNGKGFGVPQNRERVYIVGHLRGTSRPEVFPFIGENGEAETPVKIVAHRAGNRRNYQVFAKDGATEALNTAQGGGRGHHVMESATARRLTPKECERLMGYPDDWTKFGDEYWGDQIHETKQISDSQRFKMCGNGIIVPVVREIAKRLLTKNFMV